MRRELNRRRIHLKALQTSSFVNGCRHLSFVKTCLSSCWIFARCFGVSSSWSDTLPAQLNKDPHKKENLKLGEMDDTQGNASGHEQDNSKAASANIRESRVPAPVGCIGVVPVGTFPAADVDGIGAEIVAYDSQSQRAFFTSAEANKLGVLDITNPADAGRRIQRHRSFPYGGGPNSVAVFNGIVAVAVQANIKTDAGSVVFLDANGVLLGQVTVGALPDMLTFSPDGTRILVANEGEPSSYGELDSVDPEGSISIIDLSSGVANATVATADFTAFNSLQDDLIAHGVRIFGPGATVAQDFEPEYITVSDDGTTAYVTLQENNALAIVDIASATVTEVLPLGYKDHSLAGNGLDASDRDGGVNIQNWPVFGMYQPDAIASYTVSGHTYLITANEGDARDYDGFC